MNKAKAERKFGKMEKVYLTKLAPNCGCAAKVGPGTLAGVLCGLPKFQDPHLLVGTETSDDAAVYKISDEIAMIQTLDFFTPVADDPYDFGQIAAANALSDVYAMGGEPKLALNIAAFPNCLDPEILGEILRGGADKVMEAGASLAGGHTIQDDEPKYGLCVTGFVNPASMWKNIGAETGDVLILTKPLGTGILSTAVKGEMASEEETAYAASVMATLNRYARDKVADLQIHACTDVTGFGLAGHALEMAKGSGKTLCISLGSLPIMKGALDYASMGFIPAGAYRNREFAGGECEFSWKNHSGESSENFWLEKTRCEAVENETGRSETIINEAELAAREDIVFDPQTSGGLLLSIDSQDAGKAISRLSSLSLPCAVIGRVINLQKKHLVFVK